MQIKLKRKIRPKQQHQQKKKHQKKINTNLKNNFQQIQFMLVNYPNMLLKMM